VPAHEPQDVGPLQVAVFLEELVLLAVLAIAGARLAGGTLASIALAVALPLAAAVLWGALLAPNARRRLAHPARLALKLALVAAGAVLLAAAGLAWWAVAFALASAILLTAGELAERPRA
jgi:hypothetical protein